MPTEAPLISWLEHLWQLYPARGVLVVGAGNGTSPWVDALQRWNAPSVTLVEADDAQFQHLQRSLPAREGWHLRKQVVAAEAGSVTYHHASNPAESGLLEPEHLRTLWPNLKTRQKSTRQAISLAELLPITEPAANWLLLDCLPAGALLAGAGNALTGCDVIVTRALQPEAGLEAPAPQADAGAIAQQLQAQGFCTVATQTGRHPGVVHTLHVRDRAAQLTQLQTALAQAREREHAQTQAQQAQLATLVQTEQAAKDRLAQAQQHIDRLSTELGQAQQAQQQAQQASEQARQTANSDLAERDARAQTLQRELAFVQERLTQTGRAQITATQALEERDAKLKALQAELVQTQQTAEQASEAATQTRQQLADLQSEATQWRQAAEQARADAAQTQAQARDAQAAAAKTLEERDVKLKALQADLAQAQQTAQQASEAATQTQQQVDKLQTEATEWREAAAQARADAEQTQAQARDAQAAATKTLEERDAKLKALQAELAQAKQTAQQASEAATQTQQQLASLQTEATQWREAAEKARAEAAQTQAEARDAQSAAAKTLEERDAKLKALQAELAQAKQTAQQASQAATQTQQQLASLQAEATKWREAAEQARADAAQTQAQARDAQAAASKTLEERDAKFKALQAELAQTKQANQAATENHGTLQSLLAEVQAIKASAQKAPTAPALPEPLLSSLQDIKTTVASGFNGLQASLKTAAQAAAPDSSELKSLIATQQTSLQGMAQQLGQLDLAGTLANALDAQLTKQVASSKETAKEVETRLRNDLNKGLANTVKQMEAFMRIQSFLGAGDSLGDFHGWPISPDIGLFLLDRMREQHYDLIIEFGSGTSTALFARAVEVLAQQAAAKAADGSANPAPLKTTIVSFEHDTLYHAKTLQMLKARGLDQHVRLVHAPLVDWRDGDQTYLYYDCQAILAELAQQHASQQLRILLLVDGPPGATCPNARYPAVPFVFTALGRHHIDVVLDDASRPEEKQVIEIWRAFWKMRSFRMVDNLIPSEKGIFIAAPVNK